VRPARNLNPRPRSGVMSALTKPHARRRRLTFSRARLGTGSLSLGRIDLSTGVRADLKRALALSPSAQMASQGILRITKLLKYDA
jgi:hypothetical protein